MWKQYAPPQIQFVGVIIIFEWQENKWLQNIKIIMLNINTPQPPSISIVRIHNENCVLAS